MKKRFFTLTLLTMAALLTSGGCTSVPTSPSASTRKTATDVSPEEKRPDTAYYQYMKSEIFRQKKQWDKAINALKKAIEKDEDSIYLHQSLVMLHLQNKSIDKAVAVAEKITRRHPENPRALGLLARLKLQIKKEDEAKELYQKIIQIDPTNRDAYIILGSLYMEQEEIEEAFSLYSRMLRQFPDSYIAHFFLGKIHALKNNPEYAVKSFQQAIALNANLIEPRFELIDIYESNAENAQKSSPNAEIIRLYKEILTIDIHNIRASLELPLYYHRHGRPEIARKQLTLFAQRHQRTPTTFMLAAKEFIGNKRYEDAVIIFTGLLRGAPKNPALHYLAGLARDGTGEIKKAIFHFNQIHPKSEFYRKGILHTAYLLTGNDQLDQAVAFLLKKHRELPEDIEIISYIASIYEDQKRFQDAIEMLGKGLSLYPENTEMLFRSGIVYDKWGNKDMCIRTMKKVISQEPQNATALNYLGYTYADLGIELDLAEELIKKAMALNPDDGYITDSLGWVYYQRKDYETAIFYLKTAAELSSHDPVVTEHLGDAYDKAGQFQEAMNAYKEALKTATENKNSLKEKIRNLRQRRHD